MKTRDDFYLCSNAVIRFEACYLGNECLILDISCVLLKIDRQFQFDFQCLHKGKYTPIVNINQVFEKTFGLNILSKSTPVNCNSNTKLNIPRLIAIFLYWRKKDFLLSNV